MLFLLAQKKKRHDRIGYKFAHLPFRIKFPFFFPINILKKDEC